MEKRCVTCNVDIAMVEGSVIFRCPRCGAEIVRCGNCRKTIKVWKCPECGYEGP